MVPRGISRVAEKMYYLCDEPEIFVTHKISFYDPETHSIHLNFLDNTIVDTIVKRIKGRPYWRNSTFYHELGHAFCELYQLSKSKEVRKVFGNFNKPYPEDGKFDDCPEELNPGFITVYAQAHPEEDVAECFSYLMRNRNQINHRFDYKVTKKLQFLASVIDEVIEEYW